MRIKDPLESRLKAGDEYVAYAREWVNAGVQIIGGCCGIDPEHIKALKNNLPGQGPPIAGTMFSPIIRPCRWHLAVGPVSWIAMGHY